MPKQFFTVEFKNKEDRDEILAGGPWSFGSAFIYIKKWTPKFNPAAYNPEEKPVWVRLYNLPFEFWSVDC
ncbi:hypothetical protein SUGI_1007960 [Cryptomeria japonica]|nr:hypothetical protein SUGI_1007960 [Cryptomeria japonica]